MNGLHEQALEVVRPDGSGHSNAYHAKGELVDVVEEESSQKEYEKVQCHTIQALGKFRRVYRGVWVEIVVEIPDQGTISHLSY